MYAVNNTHEYSAACMPAGSFLILSKTYFRLLSGCKLQSEREAFHKMSSMAIK